METTNPTQNPNNISPLHPVQIRSATGEGVGYCSVDAKSGVLNGFVSGQKWDMLDGSKLQPSGSK